MFSEGRSATIEAPAKVNLFLEILGKREDGYHALRSALVPISLCDRITVTPTEGEIETVIADGAEVDLADLAGSDTANNLTTRAARLLKEATGYTGGARMSLQKRIPVGGGMGGGSSDAAATLVALNEVWGTGLARADLMKLGTRLGCDVPALVHGGAVLMGGAGETVQPLPAAGEREAAGWWLVLANPRVPVSTRDIYSRYKPALTPRPDAYTNIVLSVASGDVRLAARSLFNGLQPTVTEKYPLIGKLVEELSAAGALGALVSGSGASAFGLAESQDHARRIELRLKETFGPAVWIRVVRTLPDGVMVAHGPLEA